jgi:preprotein translocase SecE subunit
MAKTRAQRKAERRRREAQQARKGGQPTETKAQHDTQVPESADVAEAELAEQGADLDALKDAPTDGDDAGAAPEPLAPSRADVGRPGESPIAVGEVEEAPAEDKISRRARKREERERRQRARESERRRQPREEVAERQRGPVIGFLVSCWAELKRVQWPDRETLIQASAVTLVFIAILAAYLGVLDAIFNWLVQRIL